MSIWSRYEAERADVRPSQTYETERRVLKVLTLA